MELNYNWQQIAQSYCGNGGGTNVYIRLYGKLNSQDINTNKTSYSLQCRVYFDKHLITSSITSNIDGTPGSYPGTLEVNNQEVTLQETSREHTHNGDGTSGNITKGCSWASIYSSVNGSTSGTFTLPTINRQAIVTSATDFTDETNPTINYTNPAGYRINARLEFGGTYINRENIPNTGTYIFNLTNEERELLRSKTPNSNSMTVREVIATYLNSEEENYWSWQDKTMTIVNANPTFNNFTYQDTNTTVTNITGNNQVLVKGLSTLQAIISTSNKMEAIKQATPKNYVATIGTINQSINYDDENDVIFNLGTINSSGTQRLNVRAYDSRNNSALVYKDIVVYDYDGPVLNVSAERENNFENRTTLKINGSFSSLIINNVEKNTIQTVQYRYKASDEESWSNWTSVAFSINDNKFNCNDIILDLDNTKSYDITVYIRDVFNIFTVKNVTIDVGKSIFFISSNEKKCYINDNEILAINDGGNNYLKYSDGTLICYGETNAFNINAGQEHQENITLPATYLNDDFIVNVSIKAGGNNWGQVVCRGGSISSNTIKLVAGNYITTSATARDIILSYTTIGKWK